MKKIDVCHFIVLNYKDPLKLNESETYILESIIFSWWVFPVLCQPLQSI